MADRRKIRRPDAAQQWIGGIHSVRSALRHGAQGVGELLTLGGRTDGRLAEVVELAKSAGIAVRIVRREELDGLLPTTNHQGVAARVQVPAALGEAELRALLEGLDHPPLLLVLDGVQDPHNLGACLRTADAAGVDGVVAPRDRSAGLTPTVCKVASGAAEVMPFFQVTNLARTLHWLKQEIGIWVIGTAGDAETVVFDADLSGSLAFVLGAEERGMRRLTREHCDAVVKLPMLGSVESLNVSVATGVCLFEALRQRKASTVASSRTRL